MKKKNKQTGKQRKKNSQYGCRKEKKGNRLWERCDKYFTGYFWWTCFPSQ